MKKNLLLGFAFFTFLGLRAQVDPVLMEINNKQITKSEFLQIYLKNNPNPKYDKASLDEYMDLFKKFKLKVAEAEALGYDTIPSLKKELDGYNKQLALPYLIDAAKNEELVKEAYDRTKNEVRASHILIRLEPTALPEDTLKAYNKILALKARIDNGEGFDAVAKGPGGSEDPSAVSNGGDLGYFTAFQMVYPFEDAAFKTPVGKVSMPFRTRFGYHIVKVVDIRPTRGTIKTAHIMVATGKAASEEDRFNAEKKINELYDKLVNGGNFETLAKEHSDDPNSSQKGGELPLFGTGSSTRMVPVFEEAAFSLTKNGDFSKPVLTDYGYHIIKRLDWYAVKSYDEMKKELQAKVNKDERSKKTQDSFVSNLKKVYTYENKSAKSIKWFVKNIDAEYPKGKWNADQLKSDKVMFVLDGKGHGQKEFAAYLMKNYRSVKQTNNNKEIVNQQYINWEKDVILAHEESKLSTKYPEYKALLNEYHDGILLFEIMTDKVWNKALKDTLGLKKYFEDNQSKYTWNKRVDVEVYECLNTTIANQVTKMLKSNDTITSKHVLDLVNKESELNLKVKTNKFEIEQTAYLKNRELKKGINQPFEFEGKTYVLKVKEILEPTHKQFSEAKGVSTSDYQNYLEKEWLAELNKKHNIKVNESVLYSIGQ